MREGLAIQLPSQALRRLPFPSSGQRLGLAGTSSLYSPHSHSGDPASCGLLTVPPAPFRRISCPIWDNCGDAPSRKPARGGISPLAPQLPLASA